MEHDTFFGLISCFFLLFSSSLCYIIKLHTHTRTSLIESGCFFESAESFKLKSLDRVLILCGHCILNKYLEIDTSKHTILLYSFFSCSNIHKLRYNIQ